MSASHEDRQRHAWRSATFFFAYFASAGVYGTYLAVWLTERGLTPSQIGLVIALVSTTQIFGPNLWGEIANRSGRVALWIRAGVAAAMLCALLLIIAQGALWLGALLFAIGVATAGAISLNETLLMRLVGDDTKTYGRARAFGSAGFVAGVMLSGLIFQWTGIGWFAVLYALVMVTAVWAAKRLPEVSVSAMRVAHEPLGVLLRRGEVVVFYLLCFLMVVAQGPFLAFLSLHLIESGYGKIGVSTLWTVGVVAEILVFLRLRRVEGEARVHRLMLIAFVLTGLRFILTGWLAATPVVAFAAQALHAFTFGVFHVCAMQRIRALFAPAHYAHAQGLYIAISYGIGGLAGAAISGWIYEHAGGAWAFTFGGAVALIGAVVVANLVRQGLPSKR